MTGTGLKCILLLDMAMLPCWFPSKHHSLEGRGHGRTIPLAVLAAVKIRKRDRLSSDDLGPDLVCSDNRAPGELADIHRPFDFVDCANPRRDLWSDKLAPVFYSCNPSVIDPATNSMQFQECTQIFFKRRSR